MAGVQEAVRTQQTKTDPIDRTEQTDETVGSTEESVSEANDQYEVSTTDTTISDTHAPSRNGSISEDPTLRRELDARFLLAQAPGSVPGHTAAQPIHATASSTAPTATPHQLIEGSRNTFDLAAQQLENGDGTGAADILEAGARELRAGMDGATSTEKDVLETLAHNMEKRAIAYRQEHPDDILGAAGSLSLYGRNATLFGEALNETHPEYGQLLSQVGRDSKVQAQLMAQSARNTKSMVGRAVGETYRDIANASFDHDIANTGIIHNALTGAKDELEVDKAKVNEVFDYIDRKMETEGIAFHEAWHAMFEDHRVQTPDELPNFATAHDAATFLRDHETTRGLLSPMTELSRGIVDGDAQGVDRARGRLVESLRENGQWGLAKMVLADYQANATTPDGRANAQHLADNERGEYWKAKASEFATEDLPVLLLSGVVSGGAGLGARVLTSAAGWTTRASRIAGVATEIGTFVPAERVLSDAINGRRADWSAEGLARDYALTAGSYGLFRALGAGWRALRKPAVRPVTGPNAPTAPTGRQTPIRPGEAPENIQAITRENQSAATLARNGYRVEQNPVVPGGKNPDYRIGSQIFDAYAPTTGNARNIATNIQGKVEAEQARRIVLNLDDSAVTMDALKKQLRDWPIDGLEQLIVVRNGQVTNIPLPTPPTPWIGLYPPQERD